MPPSLTDKLRYIYIVHAKRRFDGFLTLLAFLAMNMHLGAGTYIGVTVISTVLNLR